jgi:hypothetical protein
MIAAFALAAGGLYHYYYERLMLSFVRKQLSNRQGQVGVV